MLHPKCGIIPVNASKYWAKSAKCTHLSKIKEMGHKVYMYPTYNEHYVNTRRNGEKSKKIKLKMENICKVLELISKMNL
jgi:hypothetical protein